MLPARLLRGLGKTYTNYSKSKIGSIETKRISSIC
nr:MAG TPA: hypothetical protein [Caudoviricetes sp.]